MDSVTQVDNSATLLRQGFGGPSWRPSFAKASAGQAVNPPLAGPRPRNAPGGRTGPRPQIRPQVRHAIVALSGGGI